MDEHERVRRSKILSAWLRHKPERGGLTLSPEGWAAISAILEALERQGVPTSIEELKHVLRVDPKSRFEIDGDRIRARYGHSVELEAKPHPGTPPATLYHGTPRRFLPGILEAGLKPMKRQFVHLSPDRKTARDVGRRRDQEPAILSVDAHRAHDDGIQFYPRGKGIWLSDPIPAEYLTVLEETGFEVPNRPPSRPTAPGTPRRRRPAGGFTKQ